MNFLVINNGVERTREVLEYDLRLVRQIKETNEEKYSKKEKELVGKLKCLTLYEKILETKHEYREVLLLKHKKPNQYIERCQEMIKDIKGIDFNKKTGLFRVRVTENGKRKQIGEFDTPQDAIEIIQCYLN